MCIRDRLSAADHHYPTSFWVWLAAMHKIKMHVLNGGWLWVASKAPIESITLALLSAAQTPLYAC